MFTSGDINLYKLYVIIFVCLILSLKVLPAHYPRFYIGRREQLIFVVMWFVVIHSLLFSSDLSKSSIVFVGLLWLLILQLTNLSFGVDRALAVLRTIALFFGYLVLMANLISLVVYGREVLSSENNYFGLTGNANYLASLLATFCFPIYLGMLSKQSGFAQKLYWTTLALLTVILILLTRSRTSFFAIAISTFVYFFFICGSGLDASRRIFLRSILVTLLLVMLAFSIETVLKKNEDKSIYSTRSHLVELRLEAIAERPLTGWGFAVNKFTHYDRFNKFNSGEKGNTVLAILEELGLIFGPLFLIYLGWLFWRAYWVFLSRTDTIPFALVVVSSVVQLQGETWLFNYYGFTSLFLWAVLFFSLCLPASQRPINKNELFISPDNRMQQLPTFASGVTSRSEKNSR